ncbi:MAG: NADH-quinone oxidoreductase subunit A [Actinobacteria bacterium]|nr:NADH-quinone oxidoreductase subunit A [Actinomycetota bacterium]MCL6105189.1 NADH-quinone oxidoreductase subunit A [Actinomycetota bacterium]
MILASMVDYLPIFFMLVIAILFAGISFVASSLVAPKKRPTDAKVAPYECGIIPTVEPPQRFPVRFYLVAMIFIIFDIEIIFIYPWAVVYGQLGVFGLVEMGLFALTLFIPFLYLISNGALNWGPGKSKPWKDMERTTDSTIEKVSREELSFKKWD